MHGEYGSRYPDKNPYFNLRFTNYNKNINPSNRNETTKDVYIEQYIYDGIQMSYYDDEADDPEDAY